MEVKGVSVCFLKGLSLVKARVKVITIFKMDYKIGKCHIFRKTLEEHTWDH